MNLVNLQDIKINIQKSVILLYTNNELYEKNQENNPIYNSYQKNKILRNKLNQGCKRFLHRKLKHQ